VELEPQPASFAGEPGAASGGADVLAGEAAADDVGSVVSKYIEQFSRKCFHVVEAEHAGPVLPEDAARLRVEFTEGHRFHAGALQPEREAADATEQV
jgi:hypothetical protein